MIAFISSFPENYLGHTAKNAVITVPAYFNDSQRQVSQHIYLGNYWYLGQKVENTLLSLF